MVVTRRAGRGSATVPVAIDGPYLHNKMGGNNNNMSTASLDRSKGIIKDLILLREGDEGSGSKAVKVLQRNGVDLCR
jgi:hypothetical protein